MVEVLVILIWKRFILRSFGVSSIDELPVLSPVQVEEFKQEAEEEMHVKLDV